VYGALIENTNNHRAQSEWRRLSAIVSVVVLVATIIANVWMYSQYYQPTLELLRESKLKKSEIVLFIDKSNSWEYTADSKGNIQLQNKTLIISYREPTEFKLFVSNLGSKPALLEFIFVTVAISDSVNRSFMMSIAPVYSNGTIIEPLETFEFNYTLSLGWATKMGASWPGKGVLAFAVMTTETTLNKTIRFEIVY